MDGLSQQDRVNRVSNTKRFDVIDNSMESLLYRVEAIAGFIRYHNLKMQPDGYFDRFLNELRRIRDQGIDNFHPDGNMEPAQALLYAFLQQYHEITETFNRRWDDYIYWRLIDCLGAQPFVPESHQVCLRFSKNTTETVSIKKDTRFSPDGDYPNVPAYLPREDTIIENVTIENVLSLQLNEQKNSIACVEHEIVTSLKIKDLLNTAPTGSSMFDENTNITPLGFIISSPSFLLHEGKRKVTLTFTSEPVLTSGMALPHQMAIAPENIATGYEDTGTIKKIFYMWISVSEGWKQVSNDSYSVNRENGSHVFKFTLSEDFPETTPCLTEVHEINTEMPAVRIHLNYNANLDEHPLIKDLYFSQVRIKTQVDGIKNVSVYNELGKLDCSKPFAPFGINTEKGCYFMTGNYEMARKNTQTMNLHIDWNNLSDDPTGMKGYYSGYKPPIDNTSFKVEAACLTDNRWENTGKYPLFGNTADCRLNNKTVLGNITVKNMTPTADSEEAYDYSIRSKGGFVKFTLSAPEQGFGEKAYRNLFIQFFLKQAQSKKKLTKYLLPNEPYKPVIERIQLDYVSEETVDFRQYETTSSLAFYHVTPFGCKQVFPKSKQPYVRAFYSIDAKANILTGLRNVNKGSLLSLYFDFLPLRKKITSHELPAIKWSLGNGYDRTAIPDGNLLVDKTQNLMQSGIIQFAIPNDLDDSLFADGGLIWLRAGIEKNEHAIPNLKKLVVNVAEAEADKEAKELYDRRSLSDAIWKADRQIPGIEEIGTVESYHGKKRENSEMCLMRVSEFSTHRGQAVTPRDYERLTLQEFPQIAKVKCLPARPNKKGTVTLVIIPRSSLQNKNDRLLATSRQILKVEQFFKHNTSAYVNRVDVINPLYEEVIVRCLVTFRNNLPAAYCRSLLANRLDELIAPWIFNRQLPAFDAFLNPPAIHQNITEQEYIAEIKHLSFVVVSKKETGAACRLYEHGKAKTGIRPSEPYAIFVPAKEHHINTDFSNTFGINEMEVGESFILS